MKNSTSWILALAIFVFWVLPQILGVVLKAGFSGVMAGTYNYFYSVKRRLSK